VKLLQERIEETLAHTGLGNYFPNITPRAQQLRERIDKWDTSNQKASS
jgi:hypothetical protein